MEKTENEDFAKEIAAGRAVARFYRELAWFQVNAIGYVSRAETAEDKNDRIDEIIAFVETSGLRAEKPFLVLAQDPNCQVPPCYLDMGVCIHPL